MYNIVLRSACPVVLGLLCRSLTTHRWPLADIFHPGGFLACSPLSFSLYLSLRVVSTYSQLGIVKHHVIPMMLNYGNVPRLEKLKLIRKKVVIYVVT